jgi:endonuclease/exonuclease/phosphatase family metal-dependent hydrolase
MDRALQYYAEFLSSGLLVVAGDFNDNIRWDKPRGRWSHGKTVKRLRDFGLVSAYHTFHTVAQGAEQHPTMYWRDRKKGGPAYHIDYCFIPAAWRVAAADVGEFDPWVRLSDHVPLIIDVDPMGANEGDIRGRR